MSAASMPDCGQAGRGAQRGAPARMLLVSGSEERGGLALAAGVGVEVAMAARVPVLVAELSEQPRRRTPALLASPAARELEELLRAEEMEAGARGHLCRLSVKAGEEGLDLLAAAAATATTAPGALVVVRLPAGLWVDALSHEGLGADAGLLLAELPRERSLAALAVAELRARGHRAKVATGAPAGLAARRALAGLRPGGRRAARLARIARWALGGTPRGAEREPRARPGSPAAPPRGTLAGEEGGQALPPVLAAALAIVGCALVLAAIGGAVTGKGRVQRAADLAALSAARSMRDDLPWALAPARLPDGSPNPRHLSRAEYLGRAEAAALGAAERNGVEATRLTVAFPGAQAGVGPPVRARVRVDAEIPAEALPGPGEADGTGSHSPRAIRLAASATAEAAPPGGGWTGVEARASGGGYSGPLIYRDGEGMRPDVGAAYDRMAAAARAAGVALAVSSGFRSDAEQAALFAAHPDPRWVAPPGHSLHRCATELDLGPSSAYGWLAANAHRFGFVKRYTWEPWHFGFEAGPPPCSAAGEGGGVAGGSPGGGLAGGGGDPDGDGSAQGLPAFVPARYREPLLRSAGRWGVSAALLAAQLEAESGFDPGAVSPAGAQGIAQFMPGTAASYGLRDPFDPVAAIDAQAHLMSDLMQQFRSVPLALAAYNAGPGAVAPCMCVPAYPETRAYVARILALLDGAGALAVPALEVRLVK
ncbi:MAG: transglycosylase SLT domain-containing protein [Solirubrobacterales bacterium]